MKQGNGTDVLGLNDPRNASIGVIYVSPNDEKKSVLAAILTQEKLGRKQVAVVLPDQNKAFQRPGDFDDLKSLRGKLQTQIVFIAPGGPGPAAFARQRNFPVYSTLEIFAKAVKAEKPPQPENKKGWFFGVGKQKAPTLSDVPATPGVVEAGSFVAPLSGEEEPVSYNDHVVPLVLGGAELVTPPTVANGQSTAPREKNVSDVSPHPIREENDWHALAPVAAASTVVATEPVETKNSTSDSNGHHIEGENNEDVSGIILLAPMRAKPTVKLPVVKAAAGVPVAKPEAQVPSTPRATKQRNSGKVVAVGAAVAGSMAAASLARTAGVGNAPPPRANASGGGSGGSGKPRRSALLIALAALLVLTTAVFGGIALSAPNLLSPLRNAIPNLASTTTVTIVPDTKTENNNYLIRGVQSNPDANKQEVLARIVTVSSASQSKTVNATGVKQTPATAATGTITFYNSLSSEQTIAITTFTLANGVKFANNANAVVPGANLPTTGFVTVNAHAITLGSIGNIGARAYNGACCTAGITAINGAFSGGQDAQDYTFVQQGDIQGAINDLQPSLLGQAETALKANIHSNEQTASPTTCSPGVSSDHNAGDKASTVTVTVKVTCQTQVYDQKGTLALVTNLLQAKAANDYGTDYALVGSVVTQAKVQSVNKGIVNLLVSAKGIWAYQFTTARQLELKKLIAGRSAADAVTILKGQKGVADASINPNSGTLPTNLDSIKFVIQPVTGLSGGGVTTGGSNTTPTVTGPGTNPTTQPGLGVGGS
ncbi:MAG: hypothetical protein NVS2B2_07160 [Ktedonobacteraceae bacterium]